MPFKNTPRVSVHDKHGMIPGIQQNRVGGLRPDTVKGEELCAEFGCRYGKHPRKRSAKLVIEKSDKRFQPPCFLPEVACGANEFLQLRLRSAPDSRDRQKPRFTKIAESLLNIYPRRILGQVRPHDHLKARLRRPPMLASPRGKQTEVVSANRVVLGLSHGQYEEQASQF